MLEFIQGHPVITTMVLIFLFCSLGVYRDRQICKILQVLADGKSEKLSASELIGFYNISRFRVHKTLEDMCHKGWLSESEKIFEVKKSKGSPRDDYVMQAKAYQITTKGSDYLHFLNNGYYPE